MADLSVFSPQPRPRHADRQNPEGGSTCPLVVSFGLQSAKKCRPINYFLMMVTARRSRVFVIVAAARVGTVPLNLT